MDGKFLGKIESAEFGQVPDRPCIFGVRLRFRICDGSFVGDGGRYSTNMNPECKWSATERNTDAYRVLEHLNDILNDAKVNYVSELINKPVEVTIEGNCFKDFRILTEVL